MSGNRPSTGEAFSHCPPSIETPKWITTNTEGVIVRLHIQPKASRSEIFGEYGEGDSIRLKVRISAPPVDDLANDELIRFLKKTTNIPVSRIHIIHGRTSKFKDVLFTGESAVEIIARIKPSE